MADVPAPRFGQPQAEAPAPNTASEKTVPDKAAPARRDDAPPRPPRDIPERSAGPVADAPPTAEDLAAGYRKAQQTLKDQPPRPPADIPNAGQKPLLAVALNDLLGPSGYGAHLRTGLTIKADNGALYSLGLQAPRLGSSPPTAYVSLYRDGSAPGYASLVQMKKGGWGGLAQVIGGGDVDHIDAGGQRFGVILYGAIQDNTCPRPAKLASEIELWPASRPDSKKKISLSAAFDAVAAAGTKIPGAGLSVVAYKDQPGGRDVSVALFGGGMTAIPASLLARQDGKLVSVSANGKKLGLRLVAAGADQTLEIFDVSAPAAKGAARPAEIPLESLADVSCK